MFLFCVFIFSLSFFSFSFYCVPCVRFHNKYIMFVYNVTNCFTHRPSTTDCWLRIFLIFDRNIFQLHRWKTYLIMFLLKKPVSAISYNVVICYTSENLLTHADSCIDINIQKSIAICTSLHLLCPQISVIYASMYICQWHWHRNC